VPVLLLAGCGHDTSVADPPVSPAPTSASATPPPKRESAEHFIRRFVAVSNRMEMRGDTERYLALTHGCRTCRLLAHQIASARANGGFYKSRGWLLKRLGVEVSGESGGANLDVISASTRFKTSAEAPIQHYSGGPLSFRLDLRRIGGQWRVTNVLQVAR
jgi:hypothetical protein